MAGKLSAISYRLSAKPNRISFFGVMGSRMRLGKKPLTAEAAEKGRGDRGDRGEKLRLRWRAGLPADG